MPPSSGYGDHSANNVIIECEPQLNIYESLNEKLLELRSKRDAVLLSHKLLKKKNDVYNKAIIYLSLVAACFETVKAQLGLADRKDFIAPMAILAPIFLTTAVTIISSLLKFKKFPEKMESNTKAAEKCYFAIIRIRQLIENLNFQEEYVSKSAYHTEVMVYYRDALDSIERTMYPKERTVLFLQAQKNLIDIQKNEYNYSTGSHHIKSKMVDLEEKRIHLNNREKSLYDISASDNLSSSGTPSIFNDISTNNDNNSCCGCLGKKIKNDIESGINLEDFTNKDTCDKTDSSVQTTPPDSTNSADPTDNTHDINTLKNIMDNANTNLDPSANVP